MRHCQRRPDKDCLFQLYIGRENGKISCFSNQFEHPWLPDLLAISFPSQALLSETEGNCLFPLYHFARDSRLMGYYHRSRFFFVKDGYF